MRTLAKYVVLQVPGWAGVSLVAYLLWRFWDLPSWAAALLLGLLLLKDALLYPFLRHSYADTPSRMVGAEALLGQTGTSDGRLEPSGWVRVRGERWRGELVGGTRSLASGRAVVVRAVRGLRVQVEPAPEQESHDT